MRQETLLETVLQTFREKTARGEPVVLEDLCHGDGDLLLRAKAVLANLATVDHQVSEETTNPGFGLDPDLIALASPRLPSFPGFEVSAELGRGGMGIVYRAYQPSLKRNVAIKTLFQSVRYSPDVKIRFHQEAASLAMMQHPSIVQIFDVGEVDEMPYLVMELVEGVGLDSVLGSRLFSPKAAAQLVASVSEGIHAAHLRGLIHRDLKPGNILLSGGKKLEGETQELEPEDLQGVLGKISDFGLAKKMDSQQDLTRTRAVVGTPCYMAPEQANAQLGSISPATDIYSLGAILYEMLVGKPPFMGGTTMETLRQVINDEPIPPSQFRPRLPKALETICLKCLEKNPKKRYADAAALASDLRAFIQGDPIKARPPSLKERAFHWGRKNPWRASAFLGLAVLFFALNAFLAYRERKNDQARIEAEKQVIQLQTTRGLDRMEQGDFAQAALWLASALDREGNLGISRERETELRLRLSAVLDQVPLYAHLALHDGPVVKGQFLPNGKGFITAGIDGTAQVALDGKDLLFKRPVEKGKPAAALVDIAPLPDGEHFLAGYDDAVVLLWNIKDGKSTGKPLLHGSDRDPDAFSMALAPGGKWLATAATDGKIRLWNLQSMKEEGEIPATGTITRLAFHLNGQWLAAACKENKALLFPFIGGKEQVFEHQGPVNTVAFSPNGDWLFTGSQDGTGKLWETISGKLTATLGHNAAIQGACFHPTSNKIVTYSKDFRAIAWEIPTGNFLFSVSHSSQIEAAAISSDGFLLATGGDDNQVRLWDMETGSPVLSLLTQTGCIRDLQFHPTKRRLLSCSDDHLVSYWVLEGSENIRRFFLREPLRFLEFSAGGNWLAGVGQSGSLVIWDKGFEDPLGVLGKPPVILPTPNGRPAKPTAMASSKDGNTIALGNETGEVFLWKKGATAQSLLLSHSKLGSGQAVTSLDFQPKGTALVAGFQDGTACLWDLAQGEKVHRLKKGRSHTQVGFNPLGNLLAIGGYQNKLDLYRFNNAGSMDQGEPEEFTMEGNFQYFAFHPTLTQGVLTTHTHNAQILDLGKRSPLNQIQQAGKITHALFSPDGKSLVTGGEDNVAQIWDFPTLNPKFPPFLHQGSVNFLEFNEKGDWLVTSATDGVARLWNCASGEPVVYPRKLPGYFNISRLHPNQPVLLRASETGVLHSWRINPKEKFTVHHMRKYASLQSSLILTGDGINAESNEAFKIKEGTYTLNLTPQKAKAYFDELKSAYPELFLLED